MLVGVDEALQEICRAGRTRAALRFVNTLDERRYVENGTTHAGGDEIETPRLLESWMRERGLLHRGEHVDARDHPAALELRKALRDFLLNRPADRRQARETALQLIAASRRFPLMLAVSNKGMVELIPVPGANALGSVLGQMIGLAETNRLARLKTCASDECRWIFFDRSKPANRHCARPPGVAIGERPGPTG